MDLVIRDEMVERAPADALVIEPDGPLTRCQRRAAALRPCRSSRWTGGKALSMTIEKLRQLPQPGVLQQQVEGRTEMELGLDGETHLRGEQRIPAEAVEGLVWKPFGIWQKIRPDGADRAPGSGVRFATGT